MMKNNILIIERRGREVSHAFIEDLSNFKDDPNMKAAVEHAIDGNNPRKVFEEFGGIGDSISAAYGEIISQRGFYFNSKFYNNPPFTVEHIIYHYSD